MLKKYLVAKQFAVNSQIYAAGEIVEMADVDAKGFVDAGNLKDYTETNPKFTVEVDQKGITDAVVKGLQALAPMTRQEPQQADFGQFLAGLAKKNLKADASPDGTFNFADYARKTLNITTNTQGQYATTTYWDPMIDVDLLEQSGIAALVKRTTLTGTNNIYKKNVVNSMGTAPAVTSESGTIGASQPTLTQFSFTLQKLTYRMDVTEEALEDTGALVSEVTGQVPEEFAKYIEDGIINGAGPLTGIVGDTNTVTISKEAGQTDNTIVAENIDKMFSAAKRPSSSVWILSRSAYAGIQGLEDGAGNRIFQGPTGIAGNVFGTLKGLPIRVSDYGQAIGIEGDIILANMRKYDVVTKGGMRMATSAHVQFLTDQQVFKFAYRLAGKPTGLKYTATDGTVIGDFLTLEARGS